MGNEQSSHQWVYNPEALTKVNTFSVNDIVRISGDMDTVKEKQEGHGGWLEEMASIDTRGDMIHVLKQYEQQQQRLLEILKVLNKLGKVKDVTVNGDLQIEVEGKTWQFNPACCTHEPQGAEANKGEFNKEDSANKGPCKFKVGDKVKCIVEVNTLKAMQEDHGGWNPRMADFIGRVGTVHFITDTGNVVVQYERGTSDPEGRTNAQAFSVNDLVRISGDMDMVKEKQEGHGGWLDEMASALNKIGRVKRVDEDGDLRVHVNGYTWAFNPSCCTRVTDGLPSGLDEMNGMFEGLLEHLTEVRGDIQVSMDSTVDNDAYRLVKAAAEGRCDIVKDFLTKYPDKVNHKHSNKTALLAASFKGHQEIVQLLLTAGANVELQDEDGDTALHNSVFGENTDVMELLIEKGASMDAVNSHGCSVLHVAVVKKNLKCVKVLLKHNCNVNFQDVAGDTALHEAIGRESSEIVEILANHPDVDFTLKNKNDFNVLHFAALKGNSLAVKKILTKSPEIVDVKKEDGFSALHLAALNGHKEICNTLISLGQADVEIRNKQKQTPLLLAVHKGQTATVLLLVSKGANVNAFDEDGNTALHLALLRKSVAVKMEHSHSRMLGTIRSQMNIATSETQRNAAIVFYLTQQGANLLHRNRFGKTPLELINDPILAEVVKQFTPADTRNQRSVNSDSLGRKVESAPSNDAADESEPPMSSLGGLASGVSSALESDVTVDQAVQHLNDDNLEGQQQSTSKSQMDTNPSSDHVVSSLQKKLRDLEESVLCRICLDRTRNMAFSCGHTVCSQCGNELKACHMCKKPISTKTLLF